MGWGADFVDLKDGSLIVIALGGFPGASAEEIGIIKSCVVIAPVAHVFDRACSRYRGFDAGGSPDDLGGHVCAGTVLSERGTVKIGGDAPSQPAKIRSDLSVRRREHSSTQDARH